MDQRAEDNVRYYLLDNQSTVDYFCNQNLVQEITPSMQTMILQTNAGNKPTSHKVKVPNYGEVWFDIEGMAKIFSFAKMEDKYHILQCNQPSKCIPKMVSSNFAGVQRVYITTNQITRLVP